MSLDFLCTLPKRVKHSLEAGQGCCLIRCPLFTSTDARLEPDSFQTGMTSFVFGTPHTSMVTWHM
jgi:hypothetical protein